MPFRVTDVEKLRVESDRIASILTLRAFNQEASIDETEFIAELERRGMVYTSAELVAIRAELITRGVIQNV